MPLKGREGGGGLGPCLTRADLPTPGGIEAEGTCNPPKGVSSLTHQRLPSGQRQCAEAFNGRKEKEVTWTCMMFVREPLAEHPLRLSTVTPWKGAGGGGVGGYTGHMRSTPATAALSWLRSAIVVGFVLLGLNSLALLFGVFVLHCCCREWCFCWFGVQ